MRTLLVTFFLCLSAMAQPPNTTAPAAPGTPPLAPVKAEEQLPDALRLQIAEAQRNEARAANDRMLAESAESFFKQRVERLSGQAGSFCGAKGKVFNDDTLLCVEDPRKAKPAAVEPAPTPAAKPK